MTAGLVAGGTFLCVVATPLLLASAYAKVMEYVNALLSVARENPTLTTTSVNEALAWAGWLCLGIGGPMLAVGLYRLIAHRRVQIIPAPAAPESEAVPSLPAL